MTRTLLALLTCTIAAAPATQPANSATPSDAASPTTRSADMTYPTPPTADIVDDYHGTSVPDPFRPLEDAQSPETRQFIEAQNRITQAYLDTPTRQRLRARLEQVINYARAGVPDTFGTQLVYARNSGLQNQSVLYTRLTPDGEERIVLDPNTWSEDGTVALSGTSYTRDGELLAYGKSVGGSDDKVVHVMNTRTGEQLDDTLEHMRFSGIAWHPGKNGFWYNKYPEPGTVPPEEERLNNKLYWHALDEDPKHDRVVFEKPSDPELSFYPWVSDNQYYLFVYGSRGTDMRDGVWYREICCDPGTWAGFTKLFDVGDAQYSIIDDEKDALYVLTDKNAPSRRFVRVDLKKPEPEAWTTIIPEPTEPGEILDNVARTKTRWVALFTKDARSVLRHYALDGSDMQEIELPTVGTVYGLETDRESDTIYYGFTGFTYPSTPFRHDLTTDESEPFATPTVPGFDPTRYETKQIFYESNDGTKVPMFITHRRGLELDGDNPTILYGYGGFNVSMQPFFSTANLVWLEEGGVYAVASIRGGGEYGSPWHDAGKLDKKQNGFDDFIAAAEYLVSEGYTKPERLAIEGGSNGGLLTAAVMLQRPELFGAVISHVPVIDMLRYHQWGTGRFWTVEYGNAEESREQFETLYAYSPLHNIKQGDDYPPTLVLTADGDDRVVPAHAFKFIAALQSANPDNFPVLLRHETAAGHGAGKPIAKILDEKADVYAFLAKTIGAFKK